MRACRHCRRELPSGALFCGECGRAVSAPAPGEAVIPEATPPSGAVSPEKADAREARHDPPTRPEPAGPLSSFGREWDSWTSSSWDDAAAAVRVGSAGAADLFEPTTPVRESESAPPLPSAPVPGLSVSAPPESGAPSGHTAPGAPARGPRIPAPPLLPVPDLPDSHPLPSALDDTAIDLESTRLVSRGAYSRYVLQFSTGESVTVTGTGLVGRNPGMEPDEFVDQLVTLVDGGRSVSKTHLAFGQEQGRFWISDRYSTNGTVVRAPEEPERRCEPGRRYLVSRGTRVDIGEQFFVVS